MSVQWNLLAFLPNLHLKAQAAFSVGELQICSGESSELSNLVSSPANETALAMLGTFVTTFGKKYRPACLLFRKSFLPTAPALRDFRNLCAVAAVAGGATSRLSGGQWNVVHSDHFLFGHHVPGNNGWITTLDGHVRGMNDEIDKFRGHSLASIDDPTSFGVLQDEPLYQMLCWAWRTLHLRRKAKRRLERVFRSLEVAFQAARYPSDGLTTANDVGTRIGLWVSAFEVLLNPKRSVDKVAIETALASCDWMDPRLPARRYSVRQNQKVVRVSLPVKLYDRLYLARNTFMHGNSIVGRPLSWTRGTKQVPLISCAPCLFAATLRLPLVRFGAPFDENDEWWSGMRQIGRALLPEGQD